MKRRLSYTRIFAAVVTSILMGCAAIPTQEMSDARQALHAARAADAQSHAVTSLDIAERQLSRAERELSAHYYLRARKDAVAARRNAIAARNMALAIGQAKEAMKLAEAEGGLSQAARTALAEAETAAAAGREEEAVQAAEHAKEQALEDLRRARETKQRDQEQENRSWLDKAAPLLQEARAAEAEMTSGMHDKLIDADAAYRHGQGKHAQELAAALLAEVRARRQETPPLAAPATLSYRVVHGDSLWMIAAKPEVYGNPLWWPLIFSSNRHGIRDPDVIRPGQVLVAERSPDAAVVAHAVVHAHKRGAWATGSQKKSDGDYLRSVP